MTTFRNVRRVALAVVAFASASGCQLITSELANPGNVGSDIRIIGPTNHTQVAVDADLPVAVGFGDIDLESFSVRLYNNDNLGTSTDITAKFNFESAQANAVLTPAEVGNGYALIIASAKNAEGVRVSAQVAFSREPDIDVSAGDRCEFLGQSRCTLPFPSDHFTIADPTTDTGRLLHLDSESLPSNSTGTPIDVSEWNRQDGFSPGSAIVLHVPEIDLAASGAAPITDIGASLAGDSAVVLLDADTGERVPHFVELDSWATTEATRALIIRPARNFIEGHRIIVAIRHLIDTHGKPIPASRAFYVYREEIPTYIPPIEDRRNSMREIFVNLSAAGVARSDLFIAWDFTIASQRNLTERLLTMRDDAYEQIKYGVPEFEVAAVQENVSSSIQRRVTGTFSVPLYLSGRGEPGTSTNYGADGLPERNGTFAANFICNIPKSIWNGSGTVTKGRAVAYGHGLLGGASEVNGFGGLMDQHSFVMCATDWIGMSANDIPNVAAILNDLSLFSTLPDRLQQAHINFQFLARLMKEADGFSSHEAFQGDGVPFIESGEVFFNGNSQGGIMGGAATAISNEWSRAALGVPGMNFSTLLTRSVHWHSFSPVIFAAYPDELDHTILYTLIQMLWDRGESNGYAAHMTDDPLPGTQPHEVLLIEAFGDHQVANIATETMARTVGAHVYQPAFVEDRTTDTTPMWDIPGLPENPFSGSVLVVWDFGTPMPPVGNLPPTSPSYGTDPHGLGRFEARLTQQVSDFLRASGNGIFGDVCVGLPCTSSV